MTGPSGTSRMITLDHCVIEFTDWGAITHHHQGVPVPATPHDTPHYREIAMRCGYLSRIPLDIATVDAWKIACLAYCQEHEFAHAFMAQKLFDRPSAVLEAIAMGHPLRGNHAIYEEITAQTFQRWTRAHERPIVGGADWDGWKAEALELLDGPNEA